MLLSYVHVVLAVWTLIRNYEARGEQLKISHLICTEIRKLSILVVYCSGSLEVLRKVVGIEEPGCVHVVRVNSPLFQVHV